jgi:MFS family permease
LEQGADRRRYNIGIIATIYTHPGFKATLHKPKPSKTGLITAIYYLGTWLSYVFLSHPASDYLGRRYAGVVGMMTSCVGAALQAGADGKGAFAMMVAGRIICGLGLAIVSTSVPLYQRYGRSSVSALLICAVRWPRRESEGTMSS